MRSTIREALARLTQGASSLDLRRNDIKTEGAREVAAALQTSTTLTSLVLHCTGLGDEGVSKVAAALQTNTTLTSLDLRCNGIGDEGARVVAAALKTNTTLTSLDLRWNVIENWGAREVAAALKTNTTLTSLDLRHNCIGNWGAREVAAALRTNTTLTSLDLNGLNATIYEKIRAYLARNAQVRDAPTPGGSQDDLVALGCGLLLSVLEYHSAEPTDLPLPYLRECTADFAAARQLGEGAFGQVFRAVDAVSGVTFAVKRLDRALLAPHADPTARAAQLRAAAREVEVLSRFRHPHIVRLLGYAFAADGDRCLVYPLLAGGALDAALREEPRAAALTWRVRPRIAAGLAKALNYLHRGGSGAKCYHRDVKAANVCLTAELTPQLIDCGLAKYVPDDAPADPSTGGRFGTPGYQCPRYVDDGKFDSKSEAYSLGIVLVELLVGEVQNERRSLYRVFVEEEEEELSDARDPRAGDWPVEMVAGLVGVIRACLAKYKERCDTRAAMERLMMLERTHCQQTAEEAQLQAVRRELERLRMEAEVAALAAVRPAEQKHTCLVCFDDFPLARGVKCAADVDSHFTCADCLEGYVREATSDGNLCCLHARGQWHGIPCPGVGCTAPPFSERALAVQLPDAAFARLTAVRDKIVERRIAQEMEATVEARLHATTNERALRVRNHILERILTLACPACGQAFIDFDACFAIYCGRCSTGFCAYCLEDCGIIHNRSSSDAAHRHVARCQYNSTGELFSSQADFETAQAQRRRRELDLYLATLSADDAARALRDCFRELRDLGLV